MTRRRILFALIAITVVIIYTKRFRKEPLSVSKKSEKAPLKKVARKKEAFKKDVVLSENLKKLVDDSLKNKERMQLVQKLLEQSSKEEKELISFIKSRNPYEDFTDPHSARHQFFMREGAIRVNALKELIEKLDDAKAVIVLREIASSAEDPTIRAIAGDMAKYKKKGKDLIPEVKKGIMSLPVPE